MIIVGAKGFAKEVLEVVNQNKNSLNVVFFDDINDDIYGKLFDKFEVLKNIFEVENYFNNISKEFTIGIGNPILRKKLCDKFTNLGGIYTSTISPFAKIGSFGIDIQEGCNIMTGTIITSDVQIKKGVLINLNCTICHDSYIDEFVERNA